MIKISTIVEKILLQSEIAYTSLENGILNLSAYAQQIHAEVEKQTKKHVKIGSIVAALSRIQKNLTKRPSIIPHLDINDISVKSGLIELAYNKTDQNLENLTKLYAKKKFDSHEFLMITHGLSEIGIICTKNLEEKFRTAFSHEQPKLFLENLLGITVRFSKDYINTPNITYAFARKFALKRINIVELVSTFTELTFIVHEDDLQISFDTLNEIFIENKKQP